MSTASGSDGSDPVFGDLDVADVRWFWSKAGYIPAGPELPSRGEVNRFSDVDSAALERAYRAQHEELDRAWWQEVAELAAKKEKRGTKQTAEQDDEAPASGNCSTPQPASGSSSAPPAASPSGNSGSKPPVGPATTWQLDDEDSEEEYRCVLVRGGYQEVDLPTRCLKFCYWPGPRHRVQRGSWFVERGGAGQWAPLRENLADQLEEAFRNKIWERRIARIRDGDVEGVKVELTALDGSGMYALMAAQDDMYLCDSNAIGKMWRGLRGVRVPGDRLRRGYQKESYTDKREAKQHEEHDAAAHEEVTSLVLATHGIGQNIEGSNIAHDTDIMRELVGSMYRQQGGEQGGRVEVLPVQWRKNLALDVDTLAEKIMPGGIRSLRSIIHQSAVEVLLYLTPLHHRDMTTSMSNNLNDVYLRFIRRNPNFQGNVNIVAHSLGSVLCYDILSHQPSLYRFLSSVNKQMAAPDTPEAPAVEGESTSAGEDNRFIGSGGRLSIGSSQPGASSLTDKRMLLDALEQEVLALKLELAAENGNAHSPARRLRESPSAVYVGAMDARSGNGDGTAHAADKDIQLRYPALSFAVDKCILLGSPLGLFLALRGVDPSKGRSLGSAAAKEVMPFAGGFGDALPACRRLYNIYHPFDPCAYRLEPLTVEGAESRRPVYIPYRGGKRIHIGTQELMEDMGHQVQQAQANMLSTLVNMKVNTSKALSAMRGRKDTEAPAPAEDAPTMASNTAEEAYNPIWRLTDGQECKEKRGRGAAGRLDFVLQDAPTENQYLSAIMAHFSYWSCPDTAMFIARAVSAADVIEGQVVSKAEKQAALEEESPFAETAQGTPEEGVPQPEQLPVSVEAVLDSDGNGQPQDVDMATDEEMAAYQEQHGQRLAFA
eukprot:jgi/Tetstr1/462935/TSEL_007883.t1